MGHYCSLLIKDGNQQTMSHILTRCDIDGFLKHYPWAKMTMEELDADLTFCARNGVTLIPMFDDKTFKPNEPPAPADLGAFFAPNGGGGLSVARWALPVVEDYDILMRRVISTFGRHLALGGIALQETAIGMDDASLHAFGYTPEKYAQYYINLVNVMFAGMQTVRQGKPVFWFQNYFAGDNKGTYIQKVIDALDPDWFYIGGPDCILGDDKLEKNVYPRYRTNESANKFIGISKPSYASGSVEDLRNFATDDLGCADLLWVYDDQYFWEAADQYFPI